MRATFPLAVASSWLIISGALAAPPTANRADLTTDVLGFTGLSSGNRRVSIALGKGEECGDTWLSHSQDPLILQENSVSCNAGTHTTANSYFRTYSMADFGLGPNFQVCEVTFGVELAESLLEDDQPITVRLYDTVDLSDLASHLIGEAGITLEDQARTYVTVPIEAATNNGALTVEVHSPDGLATLTRFFIGSNDLGQTSPSYLAAADCGVFEPIDLAEAGFPNVHFLLDVHGFAGDCEVGGPKTLYSVTGGDNDDNLLRTINPFTAETLTETPITVPNGVVLGGNGLAAEPGTDVLYAILKINLDGAGGGTGRYLATVDPATGQANVIGPLAQKFAGLAFADGVLAGLGGLYGVTGDGDEISESLFWIDPSDASSGFVCHFGRGGDGEAIAYNPVDQRLYHASGHDGNYDPATGLGVIFERYLGEVTDSDDCVTEDINIMDTALIDEETQALTWWPGENVFIWKQDHDSDAPLYRVTMDGEPTLIGELDHQAKGLAFLGGDGGTNGGGPVGETVYTVTSDEDLLRTINPFTAVTLTETPITVPDAIVTGATGLAAHPVTQTLYAILKLDTDGGGGGGASGGSGRYLATVAPNGNANVIGELAEKFAGLAFGTGAQLYGVSGDGADISESLFWIDPGDASSGYICHFGRGDDGETIAYNPTDQLIYHASGHDGNYDPATDEGVIFERYLSNGTDGDECAIEDIDIMDTALIDEEAQALAWWPSQNVFLWKQYHGADEPLFRVTANGQPTLIGDLDHQAKGIAIVGGVSPGDCNGNGIADVCDLLSGFSQDCNNNGIPDECDTAPVEVIDPDAQCADECEDAPLVCPGITYEGNTFDASASIYPPFQCGLFFGVHDVYCRYIPAYAGTVFVRVEGPRDQWVYSVHTACPPTLENQVDCNATDHFEIVFEGVAGQTYYIRTAAVGFQRGDFEMNLAGPPCLLAPNDANANQIPDECECPADVNNDGVVDQIDLGIVSASQGPCPTPPAACPADVDGNGVVNEIDGMIVGSSFGPCPNRDPNGGERP